MNPLNFSIFRDLQKLDKNALNKSRLALSDEQITLALEFKRITFNHHHICTKMVWKYNCAEMNKTAAEA